MGLAAIGRGLALALALVLAPAPVLAHPVDEVVQGAYLTLEPGAVRLEFDLTAGAEVSAPFLRTLDTNGDRRVSEAEGRFFAERVLAQTTLTLDGASAAWRVERIAVPAYDAMSAGLDGVKIYAVARRPERAGTHTVGFDNRYQPAKSQVVANIFLQPRGGWRYQVAGQQRSPDGRRYVATYATARR